MKYKFIATIEMEIEADNEDDAQETAIQLSIDIDTLMAEDIGGDSICHKPELAA